MCHIMGTFKYISYELAMSIYKNVPLLPTLGAAQYFR